MLVGRHAERERIASLLKAARNGSSGAMVLRGDAGIGKSALLRHAVSQAHEMTVLQAIGVEAESEIAFAGLSELLGPVLDRIDLIPVPQRAALTGALSLGPPSPGDRFGIYAATLSLLAATAESRPLLAVIDDAHWIDRSSQEALGFATRRLRAEGIVVLFAARDGESRTFDVEGLPELVLGPLDDGSARELLGRQLGARGVQDTARILDAACGNPLALIELPAALVARQRPGDAALLEPLTVGPRIRESFLRRVRSLPADTQALLLLAAANDRQDLATLRSAAEIRGIPDTALRAAELEHLVRIDETEFGFAHPLLRSAIYHGAASSERRDAHAALADALASSRFDERRAWHLAAAATRPDETVARALASVGASGRERGAHAVAGHAFERAAALTPGDDAAAGRFLLAAEEWLYAGRPNETLRLLEDARARATEPSIRAHIDLMRGRVSLFRQPGLETYEHLVDAAERIGDRDPAAAARLLSDAATARIIAGDVPSAAAIARRAYEAGRRAGGEVEETATIALFGTSLMIGDAKAATVLARRCREFVDADASRHLVDQQYQLLGQYLTVFEDYPTAKATLERVISAARGNGAPGLLPYPLAARAELSYRLGEWVQADAEATTSLQLAEETGQVGVASFATLLLGYIAAARGDDEAARRRVRRARRLAADAGVRPMDTYAPAVIGLLQLGLNQPRAAAQMLDEARIAADAAGVTEPNVVEWQGDLVEAYMRAGLNDEARRAADAFETRANATQRPSSLAASARCRALVSGDGVFQEHFERALSWHDRVPRPFERARTELCYGERLRRVQRLSEARERLRAAFEVFERLGAMSWSERAAHELAATGERRRRRGSPIERLTPQELQVAVIVAQGATNREASEALFISPKTIEFHLGHVYDKLHLRSRSELVRLVTTQGLDTTPRASV